MRPIARRSAADLRKKIMMKTIYYRGHIEFCNYACSYCPFAKKAASPMQIEREKESLEELHRYLQEQTEAVRLMFTPYGEALSHPFFQCALAKLSKLDAVDRIGVQTNLGLDAEGFLALLEEEDAALDKLMLWATCHPAFETTAHFAKKVNRLAKSLRISAGIVADTENLETIRRLRSELDPSIYLWINAQDQRKARFTEATIRRLEQVDPMFCNEFARYRAAEYQNARCLSTDNRYLEAKAFGEKADLKRQIGSRLARRCFFKRKQRIDEACSDHRRCDCYLGYCNFENTAAARFFGDYRAFRIPQRKCFKAIFFDLDGTLTDVRGKPLPDRTQTLSELGRRADLYLATARSLASAKRKLGRALDFFRGGVFSDGALVVDFEQKRQEVLAVERTLLDKIGEGAAPDLHSDGSILRIRLPIAAAKRLETDLMIRRHGGKAYLQAPRASKSDGIRRLMAWHALLIEEVLVMSDHISDSALFEDFLYTAAPLHAESLPAYYRVDPKHLLFLVAERDAARS